MRGAFRWLKVLGFDEGLNIGSQDLQSPSMLLGFRLLGASWVYRGP